MSTHKSPHPTKGGMKLRQNLPFTLPNIPVTNATFTPSPQKESRKCHTSCHNTLPPVVVYNVRDFSASKARNNQGRRALSLGRSRKEQVGIWTISYNHFVSFLFIFSSMESQKKKLLSKSVKNPCICV